MRDNLIRCHRREKSSERELEKVDQLYVSNVGEETLREEWAQEGDREEKLKLELS